MTAYLGYRFGLERPGWNVGDWLINYQGGFVRRGFIGELIFRSWQLTGIPPALLCLGLQMLCYGIYFRFSFLLLKSEASLLPFGLLICSPFIFTFQIMEPAGGFRKEVLYLALLGVNCWAACLPDKRNEGGGWSGKAQRTSVVCATLALYPFVILSHEMCAAFLPLLLVAHRSRLQEAIKSREGPFLAFAAGTLAISGACFWFSISTTSTAQTSLLIIESLGRHAPPEGALGWLARDASFGRREVFENLINPRYLLSFLGVTLLSAAAFYPIRDRLRRMSLDPLSAALVGLSLLGSLAIMTVAVDWGRLLYIWAASLFLLSFTFRPEAAPDPEKIGAIRLNMLSFTLAALYMLAWKIPHYYGYTAEGKLQMMLKAHLGP